MILAAEPKTKRYQYIEVGWLRVNKLGDIRLVYSRRPGDRNILAAATDHPQLSARHVIAAYSARWSIEVFFESTKKVSGLGQYQNGTYGDAVIHLHLVCFAYGLLMHIALERECAKGKKVKRRPAAECSTSELQDELRRVVWNDLAEYLGKMPSGSQVLKELERLPMAA